jgi:two-component system sensor histidine kinase DesK
VREEASATLVSVVNDGAPEVPRGDGGTGLRELAQRVEAAGGTLQAGEADGARFRVIARLPHERAPQGAASTRRAL